jgi:hypothetical protein
MFWDTFKVLVLSVLTIILFHMLLQLVQIRVTGEASPIRIGLSEFDVPRCAFATARSGAHLAESFGLSLSLPSYQPSRPSIATTSSDTPQPLGQTIAGMTPAPFSAAAAAAHGTLDDAGLFTTTDTAATTARTSSHTPPSQTAASAKSGGNGVRGTGGNSGTPPIDLESELKAWMQRESSNWAASASAATAPSSATTPVPSPATPAMSSSLAPATSPATNNNAQATSLDEVFASQQVDMKAITAGSAATSPKQTTAGGGKELAPGASSKLDSSHLSVSNSPMFMSGVTTGPVNASGAQNSCNSTSNNTSSKPDGDVGSAGAVTAFDQSDGMFASF